MRKQLNECYDEFNKYKQESSIKILKLQNLAEDLRSTALRMARARKEEKKSSGSDGGKGAKEKE